MNVRRGLFRAWVLISILWIGAETFFPLFSGNYAPRILIKGSPSEETTKAIEGPSTPSFYNYVASPSAEKLTIEFAWSLLAEPMTKHKNFLKVGSSDGTTLYIPAGYNETDRDYILDQFEQQQWSRQMTSIALFGVVPCVVLFALGYALLWVGRGFRSTNVRLGH